ncbi:AAA family ATPase [Flavobacterium sp. UMI-01]|uniref:AAA family ATPase n=1 Tax=Flavobacterium sp. UMI-01 TaxID=1441053 RepID=UPI001C7D05F4|nr:ATP-binding protein [Flavobacterium sp. UMI-01]GIZ09460.1 ATPase [Flavobacterium sp. UMI-01]
MQKKIIAIVGGPSTGKTTLINGLVSKGFCCYPEISRDIILEAQKKGIDQLFLEDPLLFSELILKGRKKQFEDALKDPHTTVFIDRGLPDVLGYLHYAKQNYPDSFGIDCLTYRYTQVFILPPWKEIHTTDQARYESYEQAEIIHQHIAKAYSDLDYTLIEIPKDTVENRIEFIRNVLEKDL